MGLTQHARQDDIKNRLLKEGVILKVGGTKYQLTIKYELQGINNANSVQPLAKEKRMGSSK